MEEFDSNEESVNWQTHQKNSRQNNKRITISVIIGAFIIGLLVIGYFSFFDTLFGAGINVSNVEITNTYMTTDYSSYLGYYSANIKGTAKNNGGKHYSTVMIEFSVYDASGNNLGTATDIISNLMSGDTWQFDAHLLQSNSKPTTYKLTSVTAY